MVSDLELLERWSTGDRLAGQTLVERHFDGVARFFRSKIDDNVEDLIQRTFLACLEHRKRGGTIDNFRAYLFTVARNELYAGFRARLRDGGDVDPEQMSAVDLASSPTRRIARAQDQAALLEALRRIPLESQIALELHYWEGLSMAEVGEALGVPAGTVKSRLFRAREQLRAQLAALGSSRESIDETMTKFEDWAQAVREHRDAST